MIEKFLESYVKKIVAYPEQVAVESRLVKDENLRLLDVFVGVQDMGRVIGKEGKMIAALKTFVSGCKAKDGLTYKITVHPNNEH
ncbi:KH domain-containing protein [Helicobacter sp. T3_23-1059]